MTRGKASFSGRSRPSTAAIRPQAPVIPGKMRYYGANATRNLSENRHVSRKGDDHAQSRNRIETSRLHLVASAGIGGELLANKREAIRLRTAMMQVEAVVKMLQPDFNVRGIAAKRRNKSNPWFKRGRLFRSAVDVMRRAGIP
jgi:hypothetical protein